jgi:hypothetical protein
LAADITDPITLLTLAQTVILTLTMIIFILSFRTQNVAIKDAAYQRALDDYTDSISLLVEKPELGSIIDEMYLQDDPHHPEREALGEKNRAVFGYMLLSYSLLERVYLLHAKKWIDADTWDQWHNWMRVMARQPMFQEVHHRSHGTFDKKFQDLVEEAMKAPP